MKIDSKFFYLIASHLKKGIVLVATGYICKSAAFWANMVLRLDVSIGEQSSALIRETWTFYQ